MPRTFQKRENSDKFKGYKVRIDDFNTEYINLLEKYYKSITEIKSYSDVFNNDNKLINTLTIDNIENISKYYNLYNEIKKNLITDYTKSNNIVKLTNLTKSKNFIEDLQIKFKNIIEDIKKENESELSETQKFNLISTISSDILHFYEEVDNLNKIFNLNLDSLLKLIKTSLINLVNKKFNKSISGNNMPKLPTNINSVNKINLNILKEIIKFKKYLDKIVSESTNLLSTNNILNNNNKKKTETNISSIINNKNKEVDDLIVKIRNLLEEYIRGKQKNISNFKVSIEHLNRKLTNLNISNNTIKEIIGKLNSLIININIDNILNKLSSNKQNTILNLSNIHSSNAEEILIVNNPNKSKINNEKKLPQIITITETGFKTFLDDNNNNIYYIKDNNSYNKKKNNSLDFNTIKDKQFKFNKIVKKNESVQNFIKKGYKYTSGKYGITINNDFINNKDNYIVVDKKNNDIVSDV